MCVHYVLSTGPSDKSISYIHTQNNQLLVAIVEKKVDYFIAINVDLSLFSGDTVVYNVYTFTTIHFNQLRGILTTSVSKVSAVLLNFCVCITHSFVLSLCSKHHQI